MALIIKGINRIGLWLLLIVLTVTVLVFPTRLTLEYYSIQSTRIFDNLPLFAVLFCIWLAVLLLLLFSKSDEQKSDWENIALVCVFSAVFLGFWTIITRNGLTNEGILHAAHVRYLNGVEKIPVGHRSLGYFDFPGLHLLGSFVSQVTGLDAIQSSALIVFSQALILAALLYTLFRRLLSSHYAAALGVLLVIAGNISLDKVNFFHPRNLGIILLVTFLVIITRNKERLFGTVPDTILMLILAVAAMMTHFVTSFLLFFIMLGIYVVQKLDRTNRENAPPLIIFLVLPFAWAMYWSFITFGSLIGTFPKVWANWAKGDVLWFLTMSAKANVGENLPLWANMSRLYWWVLIYGFGSIVGLWNLFRLKRLSPMQKRATGVLLGIIAVSAVSTLASPGGGRFDTYILYGAFAAVPILLWFLLSLRNHIRKYALTCLAVLFFVLCFPTFLAHNNMIEYDAYYPDEHASLQFLESNVVPVEQLHYFTGNWVKHLASYYVPDAYLYTLFLVETMAKGEADLWADMDRLIGRFESEAGRPDRVVVFMWSKKLKLPYQHFFGITPEHPNWQMLKDKLSRQDKIYDNGDVQLFMAMEGGS